ncbi:hypothetical protein, partial [Escherichia coli]|uniref:hypothetical protein n=1 Tax=Escherichia coli TaxID=562 RepID=UPI0028DFE851
EATAPDGSVFQSRGDALDGVFGIRVWLTERWQLAVTGDVGRMDAVQTLRGATTTFSAITFAGRDEFDYGAGHTALF